MTALHLRTLKNCARNTGLRRFVFAAATAASQASSPGTPSSCASPYAGQLRVFSPDTHDATLVLADTMVRAGSADPRVYASHLRSTRLDGVTARMESGPHGDLQAPAIALFEYRGGEKQPLHLP